MPEKTSTAKRLRRTQTNADRILWFRLRDRRLAGLKFKRQFPINRFVVDFFCADAKLVIELDGGQHSQRVAIDEKRTEILESMGYLALRFWNNDVMRNIEGVMEDILSPIRTPDPPHPTTLSPSGRGSRAPAGRYPS
jgi:very-short-patch-repair endonuclease